MYEIFQAIFTSSTITVGLFLCLTKPWAYPNFKAYKKAIQKTFFED